MAFPAGLIPAAARLASSVRDALIEAVLPAFCPLCPEPLPARSPGGVCLACWASLRLLCPPFCTRCALPFPDEPAGLRGGAVPARDGDDPPCGACLARPPAFTAARALAVYEGTARRLLHELKLAGRPEIAPPLARAMAAAWTSTAGPAAACEIVVAVPQRFWKQRRCGYNPAALLCGEVARRLGLPSGARALRKVRATSDQASLSAGRRRRNLAGAFEVRRGWRASLAGRSVLLVDDILTTGATAEECARALLRSGAGAVRVLVAARTPRV